MFIFLNKQLNNKSISCLYHFLGTLLSFFFFLIFFKIWYFFDCSFNGFQWTWFYDVCYLKLNNGNFYNLTLYFGLDGISLYFLVLTSALVLICLIISGESITTNLISYVQCFLALEIFLIFSFISLDLFFFYIFFEIILIPMYFLIMGWGSRSRKAWAAYLFFIYTALGSIFILVAIIILGYDYGTTSVHYLWYLEIPFQKQLIIWIFLFFGFFIKIPMFPMHLWLPEAHVEAPTGASIMLAGILLKLGGYGFMRFLLPVCSSVNYFYLPLVYLLAFLSILYSSLVILRQFDMKKIIAYSSIIHMNVGILGIFSLTYSGLSGGLFLMVGHGLISSGLFLLVGVLYERFNTRILFYYGGLVKRMPLFVIFLFLFTISNISFPGTVNFVGEFLTFLGVLKYSFIISFLGSFIVMFFGAFYSFWLFNRVAFGELKVLYISNFYDLTRPEFFSLSTLFYFILLLGIYPLIFFSYVDTSILLLLFNV